MPVVTIFGEEDPRYSNLYQAVLDVVLERGVGLPVVAIVGVLEFVSDTIKYGE